MDILDTIDLPPQEGFDLRADVVQDDTALPNGPSDVGDYPADTVQCWRNDDWMFVGIIVTASRNGTDLGSDSIWMVERGWFPGELYVDPLRDKDGSLDYYRADLIDNAIADARMKLTSLIDEAIDSSIDSEV